VAVAVDVAFTISTISTEIDMRPRKPSNWHEKKTRLNACHGRLVVTYSLALGSASRDDACTCDSLRGQSMSGQRAVLCARRVLSFE